jgi:hypothetical protein
VRVEDFVHESDGLLLRASEAPWDSAAFGCVVAQIDELRVVHAAATTHGLAAFQGWLDRNAVQLVSCRLPCDRLSESMWLESHGFRFIEVVLHPYCQDLSCHEGLADPEIEVASPVDADLPELMQIARTAFTNERYYTDPRVGSELSGRRYARWLETSWIHPRQKILKMSHASETVAFFVVEHGADGQVYWHLTAVNPQHHGKGYGRRV